MSGESGDRMDWDEGAERLLSALVTMTPESMRPLAEATGREECELVASDRGAEAVSAEDVVKGWIRMTPPDQRNGLVEVIDSLGYDPELFADELEDVGDWEEEEG